MGYGFAAILAGGSASVADLGINHIFHGADFHNHDLRAAWKGVLNYVKENSSGANIASRESVLGSVECTALKNARGNSDIDAQGDVDAILRAASNPTDAIKEANALGGPRGGVICSFVFVCLNCNHARAI